MNTLRICIVGLMVGKHRGNLTSQGLIVADLLTQRGHHVVATSSVRNRYVRLLDVLLTLMRTRRDIDVVSLEIYGGPSFILEDVASAVSRLLGHRVVMVLHGGALPEFMARFPTWSKRVLSRAHVMITPSTYLQRAIRPAGFQARVIPNVLQLDEYPFRMRTEVRPRLLWMRSFHPIWNPEMAIRVLARLREVYPSATLVMAGPDKGHVAAVRQLAAALRQTDAVEFVGFLDNAGKRRYAESADVFINTNRIDNMPVAIVEACALGLPVVSTDVGGIPDLLHHEHTGLLVPDNDDAAMAAAVLRLVADASLTRRLSSNGRQLAQRSASTAVIPEWERLFASCDASPLVPVSECAR